MFCKIDFDDAEENHQQVTQHLHTQSRPAQQNNRRPHREHWCGAGQIPSES